MATRTLSYGAASAVTITLANLASSATAGRKSAEVTCSGEPLGVLEVTIAMANADTLGNDKGTHVWLARSVDGGTSFDDGVTSGDAAYTHAAPPNMQYLGMVSTPVKNVTYSRRFWIYDPPEKFIVVVRNYATIALAASGSSINYYPVTETIA